MARFTPESLIQSGQVHESWRGALEASAESLREITIFLDNESAQGQSIAPVAANIFRALKMPRERVRVLILGQDPYPTEGLAVGLAFSVSPTTAPLPASLRNIFRELSDDLNLALPTVGDLSPWRDQGVLLLNRVLTTRVGTAGAHRKRGWERITEQILRALDAPDLVAVLWGADAQTAAPLLPHAQLIASAHPSPLSAYRGFFGSKPFSRVNDILAARELAPIDWSLSSSGTAVTMNSRNS